MNSVRPIGVLPFTRAKEFYWTIANDSFSCQRWRGYIDPDQLVDSPHFVQCVFSLDSHLRLNVTMYNMTISLPMPHNSSHLCPLGYVQVESIFKEGKSEIKYCGVHPIFSSFPESNRVNIAIKVKSIVFIQANIIYNVIDSGILYSNNLTSMQINNPGWIVLFTNSQTQLQTYFLQELHFQKLTVINSSTLLFLKVYDGPGTKSPLLSAAMPKRVTSTHQAVVHILHKPNGLAKYILQFESHQNIDESYADIFKGENPFHFKLPSAKFCKSEEFCALNITTITDFYFNVTMKTFEHHGLANTPGCNYAGLSVYDHLNNSYKHLKTECVRNLHGSNEERRCLSDGRKPNGITIHIYDILIFDYVHPKSSDTLTFMSQSNTMLLILFGYKEYSVMKADVTVSIMTCKVVTMHTCESFYYFSSWTDHCYVLQLLHSNLDHHLYSKHSHCFFTYFVTKQSFGKIISITGTGVLKGMDDDGFNLVHSCRCCLQKALFCFYCNLCDFEINSMDYLSPQISQCCTKANLLKSFILRNQKLINKPSICTNRGNQSNKHLHWVSPDVLF